MSKRHPIALKKKKKKGNGMIGIKLDMQKGYDKNEWGYFVGCSI
jgi:hypothetical protein